MKSQHGEEDTPKGKRSIFIAQNTPAPHLQPLHILLLSGWTHMVSKGGKIQSQSQALEVDPSIFLCHLLPQNQKQ